MPEEVTCSRCGRTRAAIAGPIPFRSELKERVLAGVCSDCWGEWLEEQVRVINELALNLGDPRSHEIIEQKARDYFGFEEGDTTP